ncbi:MAG: hypothetical protein R3B07_35755 [Polyangiaceae bacterium]
MASAFDEVADGVTTAIQAVYPEVASDKAEDGKYTHGRFPQLVWVQAPGGYGEPTQSTGIAERLMQAEVHVIAGGRNPSEDREFAENLSTMVEAGLIACGAELLGFDPQPQLAANRVHGRSYRIAFQFRVEVPAVIGTPPPIAVIKHQEHTGIIQLPGGDETVC